MFDCFVQNFNMVVGVVEDTGVIMREIRELEDQVSTAMTPTNMYVNDSAIDPNYRGVFIVC